MQFRRHPLPWWLAPFSWRRPSRAIALYVEYRRPLAPLTPSSAACWSRCARWRWPRCVLFLFRPIVLLPPASARDAVVPVLVDVSRSMRLADADGQTRLARATALLKTELLPALSRSSQTELFSVGDAAGARRRVDRLAADARQTDLAGALGAVRERYRGRASPASSCCPTAATPGTGRTAGAAPGRQRTAGVRHRHRIGRRACAIAKCSASRPAIRGSIRRRSICTCQRSARLRPRAVSAARAGERPACSTRRRSCRRPTARRSTRSSPSRPIR